MLGQSGVGKSALALGLAKHFGGVIVAADAHTIYRGFDIGTAKPTRAEQRIVPHFLLDVASPRRRYSAKEFQAAVYHLVRRLHRSDPSRPIFLVGGTMLYVDAVLQGLDFAQAPPNARLRAKLERRTTPALLRQLQRLDPRTARRIDVRNRRRLVRALEVVLRSGRPFYESRYVSPPNWRVLKLALRVRQADLDQRNVQRIDRMFRAGWAAEVRRLARQYPSSAPAWEAHGYREVCAYLAGERSLEATKRIIATKTRQNTRRQLRWLRKDVGLRWVAAGDATKAARLTRRFLLK